MERPCKCGGMNDECLFCGGTGLVNEKEIEIIKIVADKSQLKKQNSDLQSYLHPNPEKMYVSSNKSIPRKKKHIAKTLKEIKVEDGLKFVGPNNPNRKKFGDTRKLSKKKERKETKTKTKEKKIDAKAKTTAELEFLIFWKNNIKGKIIDSHEYQKCLVLFLKLRVTKREKFKHALIKTNSSKNSDISIIAKTVYDKLAL